MIQNIHWMVAGGSHTLKGLIHAAVYFNAGGDFRAESV